MERVKCKVKNQSKSLSLDTASVRTGWALYIDGKYDKSGIINLSNIKDVNVRIKEMVINIQRLINTYKPDHVVVEDIVVERNWHTFKVLATIIGGVYGLCISNDINYSCISPSGWRNIIDSNKKPRKKDELKKWDIEKAKLIVNKDFGDDEADAILIGKAYCKILNEKEK